MASPTGWYNPITVPPGQVQSGVDARLLLPSRGDLIQARLDAQRALRQAGTPRSTPIQVTPDGVIWDGHHAIRVAAESATTVDVLVVPIAVPSVGKTILQLPAR
jgi:hypothetical protein